MSGSDICFLSATELGTRIKVKELSPLEATEAYLARIERIDPSLNSYITVTAEKVLQTARQATAEITAGNYRGPLHGITFGHQGPDSHKGHPYN